MVPAASLHLSLPFPPFPLAPLRHAPIRAPKNGSHFLPTHLPCLHPPALPPARSVHQKFVTAANHHLSPPLPPPLRHAPIRAAKNSSSFLPTHLSSLHPPIFGIVPAGANANKLFCLHPVLYRASRCERKTKHDFVCWPLTLEWYLCSLVVNMITKVNASTHINKYAHSYTYVYIHIHIVVHIYIYIYTYTYKGI